MTVVWEEVYREKFPDETVEKIYPYWSALYNERADDGDRSVCRTTIARLHRTDFYERLDSLEGAAAWHELPVGSTDEEVFEIQRAAGYRGLVQLCRSEMEWAESASDPEGVARAFRRGMIVADSALQEPTLMGQMTARVRVSTMLDGLRGVITSERLSAGVLSRLGPTVMELTDETGLVYSIEVTRLDLLRMMQSIHTDGGEDEGMLVVSELEDAMLAYYQDPLREFSTMRYANAAGPAFTSLATKIEKIDAIRDGMLAREADRVAGREMSFDLPAFVRERLSWRDAPLHYSVELFFGTAEQWALMEQINRRAMKLLWAIEMYRAMTRQYPERLEDLVPSFIGSIPDDPASPGRFFGYRLKEPTEDDPRGYLLYSVGLDGVDDGGAEPEYGGADALRSGKGEGIDFVINAKR